MIQDPSAGRVASDLEEPHLLSGCDAGRWRVISFAFPVLNFGISAVSVEGSAVEYGFRAELENFPSQPPKVRIWDHSTNAALAAHLRPMGGPRVQTTFQCWDSDTVYRPWERMTGPHNNNATTYPHLAWRPDRRLSFIFEDLHGILNCNARAQRYRASA